MTVKVIFICLLTSLAIGCARVRIAGSGNDPVELATAAREEDLQIRDTDM